ncbi:hypothetical protein V2W30_22550 [Streptomyces sp. Q6]|uniref:Uncharacterized protein n=1 Tax=Streptomyces citrinus TaxID=3118173 RepID=A0ACD5AF69_9ACTN
MTGPSSTPHGEHAPRPGTTWDTRVVWDEEHVIADDDLTALPSPEAAWATSTTRGERAADSAPAPTPNRATRRALARAARRK